MSRCEEITFTVVLHDAPYATERSWNGRRFAERALDSELEAGDLVAAVKMRTMAEFVSRCRDSQHVVSF